MGTTLRVAVAAGTRAEGIAAIENAFTAVRRLDSLLSTWRGDSEIAAVNAAEPGTPVPVSSDLYDLLAEAADWSRRTGGAFDPAVGSLVDAWGLRDVGRVPSPAALAAARSAAGLDGFVFADAPRTIARRHAGAWLDSGGFGKGAALREAARALRARGVASARLNFGGQVLVFGPPPRGEAWVVPVAHPGRRNEPVASLRLRDRSASTSSQSERGVTAGGRRLGHVLDPRTGEPVPAWGSVTVVAADPMVADILSTALLVMGPDEAWRWAEGRRDVGVLLLVEREGRVLPRWNEALGGLLESTTILTRGG